LKNKSISCLLVITTIIGIISFSCQNSGFTEKEVKNISPPKVRSQVNWVGHWLKEGARLKLVNEVATEFEFQNQEIQINLKFPEELYNADDSLEIQFIISQMKKPVADWDIIRIKEHYNPIASILGDIKWGEKYLVDFSSVPGFLDRHQAFVNTSLFKSHSGNILIGPYIEGQFWALYVNMDVAKKMGIQVKQYDMTFDDFLSYVKSAYDYNKSHNTHIVTIFEDKFWISTEAIWKQLFFSLMGHFDKLDTKLTQEKLDAIQKCYEACEQLSKYNPIIKNRLKITWERDNDYPLKDSCLFFVNGSWMYNIWKDKNAEKMKSIIPCELPVFKPSDICLGGYTSNWAVLKNAPHREDAIKLLMYWTEPQVAEKWARYTKCPTGLKGNLTTTSFGTDEYENFMYNIEKRYGGRKISEVDNKYAVGEKNFGVNLKIIDVLEGRLSAKDAFKELNKKLVY
jgi:ABC-type glycerol-3-phosphate transport system substrate-binding protein